jgi:D-alanyl-D-alanine dipeptidase
MYLFQIEKPYKIFLTTVIFFFFFAGNGIAQPSYRQEKMKNSDLVELITLDSTFHLDIRYATENNFTNRAVYKEARAFLQRPAAVALARVNSELLFMGYGLVIFDGYRPWSVTKLFWDVTSLENKKFVANPAVGSRHNRGCAIDVSLCDLYTGEEIQMTGAYDEMSERSYKNYSGGSPAQRKARDLLINRMEIHGFTVHPYEWWHFDYKGWNKYPIQNIQFSEIK